jgi:hypothetical protein
MFRDEVKGIKKWLILEPEMKANCRKFKVGRNYGRRRKISYSVL